MYHFSEYSCYIDQPTSLLCVCGYDGSVALSCEEVNRLKSIFFKGDFETDSNIFHLCGDVVSICDKKSYQIVSISLRDLGHVYQYYERHKDRIAKCIPYNHRYIE